MESKDIGLICLNCQKPILQYHKKPPKSKFHRGCRKPYLKKGMHKCACGRCDEWIPDFTFNLKPQEFKQGHYAKQNPRKAEDSNFWKGGIRKDSHGYNMIYSPEHPFRTKAGYVYEHRLVMEKHLGRYLTKDEDVHHINRNKKDNRIENLQLMTKGEHSRMHRLSDSQRVKDIRRQKIMEYIRKRYPTY